MKRMVLAGLVSVVASQAALAEAVVGDGPGARAQAQIAAANSIRVAMKETPKPQASLAPDAAAERGTMIVPQPDVQKVPLPDNADGVQWGCGTRGDGNWLDLQPLAPSLAADRSRAVVC